MSKSAAFIADWMGLPSTERLRDILLDIALEDGQINMNEFEDASDHRRIMTEYELLAQRIMDRL